MRHLALGCALAALAWTAPAAHAGTPLATYESPQCPGGAPTWHILYEFYERNGDGATLSGNGTPGALENAREFADQVAALSECAVRVRVDVVQEAGAMPTRYERPAAPYDAVFKRFPSPGPGDTAGSTDEQGTVWFPVAEPDSAEPNENLIVHEWLHNAVAYYRTPLGWPRGDVHGACDRPDYGTYRAPDGRRWGCMVNPRWFADLMTGRIVEDGVHRGIPREQWAYQGRPRDPLRQLAEPEAEYSLRDFDTEVETGELQMSVEYRNPFFNRASLQRTFAGPARVRVLREGRLVLQRDLTFTGHEELHRRADVGVLPRGTYEICADVLDSPGWEPVTHCRTQRVRPATSSYALVSFRRERGRATVRAFAPLVGRRARLRVRECDAALRHCRWRVDRRVRVRERMTLRYPPLRRGRNSIRVRLSVDGFTAEGERYGRGSWTEG